VAVPVLDDVEPLVTTDAALERVIEQVLGSARYALDTEFHRERTYWPRVALVQISWEAGPDRPAPVALIDPLAVDIGPLRAVLAGPATMVAHAAEQDLEVLDRACGQGPGRLFDTQVAAAFAGLGSASLGALSVRYLDREVPKGDRLTDWSRRPLTSSQLRYAASDVDRLLDLADCVEADLRRAGRLSWAEEECEVLRRRAATPADPRRAWWKLRDARQLRGPSRGVAQELSAWREQRARTVDLPVRTVLPDLALQSIAHMPPANAAALRRVRGLEERHLRAGVVEELLAAVERGRALSESELVLPPAEEVPKELRPAVALAMAWVAQVGRDERIDAAVLATRGDLVSFLRGDPTSRLATGWRNAMLGVPLQRLVDGEGALAFEGAGRLVVEERSHRPLGAAHDGRSSTA